MLFAGVGAGERLVAEGAEEGADAGVFAHVHLEVLASGEGRSAQRTQEGFLRVCLGALPRPRAHTNTAGGAAVTENAGRLILLHQTVVT